MQTPMNKKHAYLIIAHNHFDMLRQLLVMLDQPYNDIYVHVDKKAKSFRKSDFENVTKYAQLFFTKRIKVFWGHSSQVDCEMILLKACVKKETYAHVHLLSGVDMPIKKPEYIYQFFQSHPNSQFLQIGGIERHLWPLNNYYFTVKQKNEKIKKHIDTITEILSYKLKIDRLKKYEDLVLLKAANWFSITGKCAEYVVSKKRFIKKITRYSVCADELFLPTIIRNSPYWDQVYNKNDSWDGHMRYIDRIRKEGSSPHTFTIEDKESIERSEMLFARKFDNTVDSEIVNYVFEQYRE